MKSFKWNLSNEVFKSSCNNESFQMKFYKQNRLNEILQMKSFQWNVLKEMF